MPARALANSGAVEEVSSWIILSPTGWSAARYSATVACSCVQCPLAHKNRRVVFATM